MLWYDSKLNTFKYVQETCCKIFNILWLMVNKYLIAYILMVLVGAFIWNYLHWTHEQYLNVKKKKKYAEKYIVAKIFSRGKIDSLKGWYMR